MLGHKTSLSKSKDIEIILSIFFNHNGMKQEMSNRRKLENLQMCGIKQYPTDQLMGQRRN